MENNIASNNKAINLQRLVLVSLLLAILVIGLGAYTRLTHAGLGCPDWPGCYGLIDVPQTPEQIQKAEQAFPERPVEPEKAWNEMIHRYFAGSLGLFILTIAVISFNLRQRGLPFKLPLFLLALVIFQAALGMWTVTMKLMPIVVMAHLLGGFTTLCLLFLLYLRLANNAPTKPSPNKRYMTLGIIGIAILAGQIALGGWTSANYAAMSCVELPICQGDWSKQLSFKEAFELIPPKRDSYEFGYLPHEARVTIHISHRFGAVITSIYLLWLATWVIRKNTNIKAQQYAKAVLVVLSLQVLLGISNIWFTLPLSVAVAHNLVAACLMLCLIALTFHLVKEPAKQVNPIRGSINYG